MHLSEACGKTLAKNEDAESLSEGLKPNWETEQGSGLIILVLCFLSLNVHCF